jgi:hypothetical protein
MAAPINPCRDFMPGETETVYDALARSVQSGHDAGPGGAITGKEDFPRFLNRQGLFQLVKQGFPVSTEIYLNNPFLRFGDCPTIGIRRRKK